MKVESGVAASSHDGEGHRHHSDVAPAERAGQIRKALALERFSLAWNFLETFVGIGAGIAAGSVALIGFGLDSVVESSSAAILIWRLRRERDGSANSEDSERKAVRMVAVAFFALAAYVGTQAIYELVTRSRPEESPIGIALAVVSLIVMPWLAARKRRMAKLLDSRSMQADSDQTSLCTLISAFLLVGLAANAWLGWWWADGVAALAIAALALREGLELWKTEHFCTC